MNDMNDKHASVAARIAELGHLPMAELWTLWDRYFERRPEFPNRTFVESRLAYKLQEEAFGGLPPPNPPAPGGHRRQALQDQTACPRAQVRLRPRHRAVARVGRA